MRLFKRPTGNPDPLAFMERLERVHFGDGGYTAADRYRDLRKVFLSTPEGRRVLWWLLDMTHIYAPSFDPANMDPNLTFIKEGERNIGLAIHATMNADPDGFPQE